MTEQTPEQMIGLIQIMPDSGMKLSDIKDVHTPVLRVGYETEPLTHTQRLARVILYPGVVDLVPTSTYTERLRWAKDVDFNELQDEITKLFREQQPKWFKNGWGFYLTYTLVLRDDNDGYGPYYEFDLVILRDTVHDHSPKETIILPNIGQHSQERGSANA